MPNLFRTLSAWAVEPNIHSCLFFYPELTRTKLRSRGKVYPKMARQKKILTIADQQHDIQQRIAAVEALGRTECPQCASPYDRGKYARPYLYLQVVWVIAGQKTLLWRLWAGSSRIFIKNTHGTGSLRDAQAQLGHSKMSTTLEIYTLPIPEQQRTTVEELSVLMANDGKLEQNPERLPLASQQIQDKW
jgi:hypothetical protein